MNEEAHIEINGKCLNVGQSFAVRVAVTHFIMSLRDDGLGGDEHAMKMCDAYISRLTEVESLLVTGENKKPSEEG